MKVGGIVVAKSCAAILDAKTELNSDAATSMVLKIDAIRYICVPSFFNFVGMNGRALT